MIVGEALDPLEVNGREARIEDLMGRMFSYIKYMRASGITHGDGTIRERGAGRPDQMSNILQ